MPRVRLGLVILALVTLSVSAAHAVTIGPNLTTPIGPGFDLVTLPVGPADRPEVFVAFNPFFPPTPCSGSTCGTASLDLTTATTPVLNLQPPGPTDRTFSLFWGMIPPGPNDRFVYALPSTPPNADGNYSWTATLFGPPSPLGPSPILSQFAGSFQLATASPIDPASWVVIPPGPGDRGAATFQINFRLTPPGPADPTLTFALAQDGTPLAFSPVPAPATLALVGAGLAALGVRGWRRRRRG